MSRPSSPRVKFITNSVNQYQQQKINSPLYQPFKVYTYASNNIMNQSKTVQQIQKGNGFDSLYQNQNIKPATSYYQLPPLNTGNRETIINQLRTDGRVSSQLNKKGYIVQSVPQFKTLPISHTTNNNSIETYISRYHQANKQVNKKEAQQNYSLNGNSLSAQIQKNYPLCCKPWFLILMGLLVAAALAGLLYFSFKNRAQPGQPNINTRLQVQNMFSESQNSQSVNSNSNVPNKTPNSNPTTVVFLPNKNGSVETSSSLKSTATNTTFKNQNQKISSIPSLTTAPIVKTSGQGLTATTKGYAYVDPLTLSPGSTVIVKHQLNRLRHNLNKMIY